jgi:2-keto-myo-inositol isomerase
VQRALNQATVPGLSYPEFLDLARRLGCVGVEPRNDLPRPLFDGIDPADAGRMARDNGLRLVGLSQVYPFNDWSDERAREVASLITTARAAGAETVSLIPRVDGKGTADGERQANLRSVLAEILPMLRGTGMIGLVEPIGFTASSLRDKAELVEAIEALDARDHIKLVHDTFQHVLAGGGEIFPDHTGLVHISGISDPNVAMDETLDAHRMLIDQNDRVGNVEQIAALLGGGYAGPFSFECTASAIHTSPEVETEIRRSFEFIASRI